MRSICRFTGAGLIAILALWMGWLLVHSPTNHVRAQVKELENPEGKVIPFGKDGIEVLTHGPVHEAFAQPGTGKLAASVTVQKKPPEPLPELPPDQKPEGTHVVWIPGYFAWDDERSDFLWVSGAWRAVPPGRDWVPGYWTEESGGWRWASGYWAELGTTTVEVVPEPPEPIAEAPPPEQADSTYVPGIWVYRQNRYWWRPGFWLAYRPGWIWTQASYAWTPAGYVFSDGYWDYEWQRRGLLFAPAYIAPRYYSGWYYRPQYAIDADLFLGALFVRSTWNHYYFGDYYDARYARLGYSPWVDYRYAGGWYDPYWSYYHWRYRATPAWETNLRQTYVTRRQNVTARPPRTLAEQQQRTTVKGTTSVALVTSLDKLPVKAVKLQPVTQAEAVQVRKTALQVQNLSHQRAKVERDAKAKAPAGQVHTAVQLELPKAQAVTPRPADHVAPPAPTVPKLHDQKPPPPKKTPLTKPPDEERKPAAKPPVTKPPDEEHKPLPKIEKKPEAPPPKTQPKKKDKDKDKGDGSAAEFRGDTRVVAVVMSSTPRERGTNSLDDPRLTPSFVRRC